MPDPYFSEPGGALFCGDCREILPMLDIGPFAVVTDPPYGIAHASGHGASWQNTEIAGDGDTSARDWVIEWGGQAPMAIFGSWKRPRPVGTRAVLIWDKGPAFGMGDLSFPWKPSWEEIYILGDGWVGRRDEGVLRGDLVVSWESRGRVHPNQKPVSLMGRLIAKLPKELTIVDPFCGSGATLRAAKDRGYRYVGIEVRETYCRRTVDSLRQEVFAF